MTIPSTCFPALKRKFTDPVKGKGLAIYAMKVCEGSKGVYPLIHDIGIRCI